MGIEPFLVASSVKMILAQRLLRRLCSKCKVPYEPRREDLSSLEVGEFHGDGHFCRLAGCPSCNNVGYKGRTAVYEILSMNSDLSDLVARGATPSELRKKAREFGMKTLAQSALKKAARGETSIEEVLRETSA